MLLAEQMTPLSIVGMIITGIVLILIALGLYYGYERLAHRSLRRCYAELAPHSVLQPGDVVLTYHTYHGLLVWFTQTPHQVVLPPEDARILLGRLLRFNLTWGLTTYGMVFVPPLSIFNYFAQRRSIADQEAAAAFPEFISKRN